MVGERPDSPVMSLLMAARESLAGHAEAVMFLMPVVDAAVVAHALRSGGLGRAVLGPLCAVMVPGWRGLQRAWLPLTCMVSRLY